MCCEERFSQELRQRGFRLTPQREMVLQVLHDLPGHATAEEVYARVSALSAAVDPSTVYRTLELLEELRLVASFDLGDGQRHYALLPVHHLHAHLRCQGCGRLITVGAQELQRLLDALTGADGFRVQVDHWVIPGLCRECQASGDRAVPAHQAA